MAAAALAEAQTLESVAHGAKTEAARHAALLRYAAAHSSERDGALALFAAAIADRPQRRSDEVLRHLRQAQPRLSALADWVAYYIAAAEFDLGNFAGAIRELDPVWEQRPPSPLLPDASMLAARAYIQSARPADAVNLLKERYQDLPQPAGDFLLGEALRAANDLATAVGYYQRVYYGYPATAEAERAASELKTLRSTLGQLFPDAGAELMLQRAERWSQAGEHRLARAEYESLIPGLSGADRDVARVRLGAADYNLYSFVQAYNYLKGLDVSAPEADAERLFYMEECGRKLEREDYILDAIGRLHREHPGSLWRMRALISAGNYFLIRNDPERYLPLYQACYASFADQPRADYCQWKVAWHAYVNRRPNARELLRDHLVRYPGSSRAGNALYFLGRLAEAEGSFDDAKEFYTEAVNRFPNRYYAALAQKRLADPQVFRALASPPVAEFLRTIVWPVPRPPAKFEPAPATQVRLNRARLLERAALEALAERELRYSARVENQPHVVAVEIATFAGRYDSAHSALRLMKSLVPGYLSIPYDAAPASFWRLLYPMPWRAQLEKYARQNGLDPYIVAGLIRQESEFNPNALSPVNAYGLTQVMPATGRQLLKMSRRRFRPRILFQPELNLRLGTTYLSEVLRRYSGRWELALAAYNAGPTRVQNWITWADYREPAEFIETIPFTETRDYVTAVLRNAEIYRALYAGRPAPPLTQIVKPGARKEPGFKRSPVVPKKKSSVRRRRR